MSFLLSFREVCRAALLCCPALLPCHQWPGDARSGHGSGACNLISIACVSVELARTGISNVYLIILIHSSLRCASRPQMNSMVHSSRVRRRVAPGQCCQCRGLDRVCRGCKFLGLYGGRTRGRRRPSWNGDMTCEYGATTRAHLAWARRKVQMFGDQDSTSVSTERVRLWDQLIVSETCLSKNGKSGASLMHEPTMLLSSCCCIVVISYHQQPPTHIIHT